MNALTSTHNAFAGAADTFVVFPSDDPMDASVCFGREQARQAFDAFSKRGRVINVWRVTLDDLERDVTDEFEEIEEFA